METRVKYEWRKKRGLPGKTETRATAKIEPLPQGKPTLLLAKQKRKALQMSLFCRATFKTGVAERIRTSDFFLRREALYPLSYSNLLIASTPIG
jgi:hypothetical protein